MTAVVVLALATATASCSAQEADDSEAKPTSRSVLGRELTPPEWTPLEITNDTYPFGSDRAANAGADIDAHGYVESEYLVSGEASVYDAIPGSDYDVKVRGESEYVTRALVRQPADPAQWSGRVFSEAGDADFDPNVTLGDENGLLWELWNQVGLSARIGPSPLPGPATAVIAAGESQGAIRLVNLYRWFGGDRATRTPTCRSAMDTWTKTVSASLPRPLTRRGCCRWVRSTSGLTCCRPTTSRPA